MLSFIAFPSLEIKKKKKKIQTGIIKMYGVWISRWRNPFVRNNPMNLKQLFVYESLYHNYKYP